MEDTVDGGLVSKVADLVDRSSEDQKEQDTENNNVCDELF